MSNFSNQNETNGKTLFSLPVLISIGITITILIILAIIGNALTIIAFCRDQKLRNVYNIYILNLAITDFLIGCISMTFYAVYTLQSYNWPFGYDFCKVYLVADFTLSLESVLAMIILSHDRLLLLKLGACYTIKESRRRAFIKIGVSWLIAFILYSPAIIGWDLWTGENIVKPYDCDVQFANNDVFTTITAVFEFLIPLFTLTSLNLWIYLKIRKRSRLHGTNRISIHRDINQMENSGVSPAGPSCISNEIQSSQTGNSAKNSTRNRTPHERKAAKCLSVLVLVFVITWTPYTITTVVISFCRSCINKDVFEFLTWLLWSKAVINPFLYAFNSTRFRKNYREILCCLLRSSHRNKVVNVVNEETVSTDQRYIRSVDGGGR